MIVKHGKGINKNIYLGNTKLFHRNENFVRYFVNDTVFEKKRFEKARFLALKQTRDLIKNIYELRGVNLTNIFDFHTMLLDDTDFVCGVNSKIECGVNAEYAVFKTGLEFTNLLSVSDDEYVKEKTIDIKDVCQRIINTLNGKNVKEETEDIGVYDRSIIIAKDITPSEILGLFSKNISGLIIEANLTSCTEILTKTVNIPTVFGVNDVYDAKYENVEAVIDPLSGVFYIEPTENIIKKLLYKEFYNNEIEKLNKSRNLKSGVYKKYSEGNTEFSNIIDFNTINYKKGLCLPNGSFKFIPKGKCHTEKEQFDIYKNITEKSKEQSIVIKTIGAKDYCNLDNLKEESKPEKQACGDLIKIRLRSVLGKSDYGCTVIMFPIVNDERELKMFCDILKDVKHEMDSEKVHYDKNMKIGVIIKTYMAALSVDKLAPLCDFISIGYDVTNSDFVFNTKNKIQSAVYDIKDSEVRRIIKISAEFTHNEKIWSSIYQESIGNEKDSENSNWDRLLM